MDEAGEEVRRRQLGGADGHRAQEREDGLLPRGVAGSRVELLDGEVEELRQPVGVAEVREPLEGPEAHVRVCEPHQHRGSRRRGLVAAEEHLAGLEQAPRLRGRHAERLQHLGGEHLSHAALEREPAVTAARPRRLAGALGAEVEEAPLGISELRVEEAAPIAEARVVHAELVAVVPERERLREVLAQGLEAGEGALPFAVVERAEADPLGPALVAETQRVPREAGGDDDIGEAFAQVEEARVGLIVGRRRHEHADRRSVARRRVARSRQLTAE